MPYEGSVNRQRGVKMIKVQYSFLVLVTALIMVIFSGCQPTTQPLEPAMSQAGTAEPIIKNVQVKHENPEKSLGDDEEFALPNCGGSGELTQSLGTQASVVKGVTIGGKATTTGGAEVAIPETVALKLQIEVELAYQQDYEMANARLDTIQMTAAAGTHVVYVIQWEKQTFTSTITFEMDGQILKTPYTYVLHVPKTNDSYPIICPTLGSVDSPVKEQPPSTEKENNSPNLTSALSSIDENREPLRDHYQVVVGDGIFAYGTFSDGQAPYSEQWLWDNDHFNIQRIRQEEYPTGCDVARYNTNLVWIGGTSGMSFSINGENIGTYKIADSAHGYVFEWPIRMGDTLCAIGFTPTGFHIILGSDIYYHYDSYCYRGGC